MLKKIKILYASVEVSGVGLVVFAQTGMWTSCGRLLFLLQSKSTQTFIREVLSGVLICEWQATTAAAGLCPNTAGGYAAVTFNLWLREGLPHLSRWHHLSVSTVAPSTLQETRVNTVHICPTSRYYLTLKGFRWRPRSESWCVICVLYHRRLSWCVRTVRKSRISVIFSYVLFWYFGLWVPPLPLPPPLPLLLLTSPLWTGVR